MVRTTRSTAKNIAAPIETHKPKQKSSSKKKPVDSRVQTAVVENIQPPAAQIPLLQAKIEQVIPKPNPEKKSFLEEVRDILSYFSSKKTLDILQAPQEKTRATFTYDGIDDDGLMAFLRKFPDVHNISLYSCPNLTERGLLAIKNFYDIYLLKAPITDAGLYILAKQSPLLERLLLHDCRDITTNAVDALQHLPNLKEISFEECNVGDEALDAIVLYCPKIQRIHVRFSCVSFLKMQEFQRKFPQIQLIW